MRAGPMKLPRWLPIALLAAIAALAGAGLLFTTFMSYDDEGYVLFSLHTFFAGGGLYERVYTQYGPFFFLFNQALHFVGVPFDNTSGRLLTLVYWLGATGFSAATVWRMTRSPAATVLTMAGVFLHLWPMTSEPSHPGGFIVFMTAAAAWCGVHWSAQPRKLATAVGVLGAALLLTKINVGIFLLAGAGVWWALHLDEQAIGQRWRTVLMGGAMALMPYALMRGRMDLEWVRTFAIVASASGAAIVLAASRTATPFTRWRDFGIAAVAAVAVAALTGAGTLLQGTSVRGLLEGVLLGPLRHPQAYTVHINWRVGAVPLALGAVVLAIWFSVRPPRGADRWIAIGRLLAGTAFFLGWAFDWPLNTHAYAMSYALGTTWLFVFTLEHERATAPVRAWLGLLTLTQALHAFPVAGSQISWGTFLWIPLAAIGLHGAVPLLAPGRIGWLRVGAAAVILVSVARTSQFAWVGVKRLREGDFIGLPGTAGLRLPANFTSTLRAMGRNATVHADMLFTLPGLLSFHSWTDVPPPTSINATHWFTLLSPTQQEEIRTRLANAPRSCLIVQRDLYQFLIDSKVPTETALTQWLHANYEPVFTLAPYEFWVRRGRHIAAINTAVAREAAAGVSPRYQFTLTLAEASLRNIAGVEFARFTGDVTEAVLTWTNDTAQCFVTPINSEGRAAGPSKPVTFPFDLSGLVRLELRTDRLPPGVDPSEGVLLLRNDRGEQLAEARLIREAMQN
jgi:hypothetical protein